MTDYHVCPTFVFRTVPGQIQAYHDDLRTCIGVYGDTWEAYHAAAECAFIREHGELPEWACFIERFEVENGALLLIHRDPEAVQ